MDEPNPRRTAATGTSPSSEAGNFTLDQYLTMLDSAPDDAAGHDGASLDTNVSPFSAAGEAAEDDEDTPTYPIAGNPALTSLAEEQMLEILHFLTLPDRTRVSMTCSHQATSRVEYDKAIKTLCAARHKLGGLFSNLLNMSDMPDMPSSSVGMQSAILRMCSESSIVPEFMTRVATIRRSREFTWSRLVGLKELNLGSLATDEFLKTIAGASDRPGGAAGGTEILLPLLETLQMVGSHDISEDGILSLGRTDTSGQKRSVLKEVDATFCTKVTYATVVKLRELLPACLLRRLPDWICGHTDTPFAGRTSWVDDSELTRDEPVEVHTYWPDGTFSYCRSVQSEGFVVRVDMIGDNPNHLGDKLQFSDFEPPPAWPNWTRYAFRPGVSLLRVPEDEQEDGRDGNIVRNVLVAQRKGGLKYPRYFPKIQHADMVPLGQSRYFHLDGRLMDDEDGNNNENNSNSIMVSRMKKRPLSKNEIIPPSDLVARNAAFLQDYENEREEFPVFAEELLHRGLQGPGAEEEVSFTYDENGNAMSTAERDTAIESDESEGIVI